MPCFNMQQPTCALIESYLSTLTAKHLSPFITKYRRWESKIKLFQNKLSIQYRQTSILRHFENKFAPYSKIRQIRLGFKIILHHNKEALTYMSHWLCWKEMRVFPMKTSGLWICYPKYKYFFLYYWLIDWLTYLFKCYLNKEDESYGIPLSSYPSDIDTFRRKLRDKICIVTLQHKLCPLFVMSYMS